MYRNQTTVWQKSFLEQTGAVGELIGSSRVPEFRAHWRELKRIRAPKVADELLDLGCQTGEFGSIAQADGIEPYGIELSPDYAEQAVKTWGVPGRVSAEPLSASSFFGHRFAYADRV